MAVQVSKEMTIGEILAINPMVAPILMELVCTVSDAHLHRENLWKKQQWYTVLT